MSDYPDRHHPCFMLEDALAALGAQAQVVRDTHTLNCWGLRVNGKLMVYLIDNRHAHEAAHEDAAARELLARGVLVCHAQQPDCERVGGYWLPLAATPSMLNAPTQVKTHDAAFVGYVRDMSRATVLAHLGAFCRLNVAQNVFGQDAAAVYAAAHVGVNVTTHYGQPTAYDSWNMRAPEIMACGIPLLTPENSTLCAIGFVEGQHGYSYRDPDHLCQLVYALVQHPRRAAEMGAEARQFVMNHHLYAHRAEQVLEWLA